MNVRTDTEHLHHWWLAAASLLLLAVLLLPGVAAAAEAVGRVISANGDVTAVRAGESARSLARGDRIYEGDEVRTGPDGLAQIRFIDEGLTNLSPESRLAVDRYRKADAGADSGGSAIMSFLRGALRTITGSIGGGDEDVYRMNTPTATIGVRGTGYALQYCDAACAAEFGGQPGLYGRVDDGSIRVDTPGGSAEFGTGDYFFVPDGGAPSRVLQPPPGILDGDEDETEGEADTAPEDVTITPLDEEEGDDLLADAERQTDEPVFEVGDQFEGDAVTGLGGASVAAAGNDGQAPFRDAQVYKEDGAFGTEADGNVDQATFDDSLLGSSSTINVDQADLKDTGSIDSLGVSWGRWEGDFSDGAATFSGNVAFTVTDNLTEPSTLGGLSGALDYALAGGPSAFDVNENIWTVDALSLNVDFDAMVVGLNQFQVSSTQARSVLAFDDSDPVGSRFLDTDNNKLGITIDGASFEGVQISGQFVGINAEGMIVVFAASDSDRVHEVTGTSILQQQ